MGKSVGGLHIRQDAKHDFCVDEIGKGYEMVIKADASEQKVYELAVSTLSAFIVFFKTHLQADENAQKIFKAELYKTIDEFFARDINSYKGTLEDAERMKKAMRQKERELLEEIMQTLKGANRL